MMVNLHKARLRSESNSDKSTSSGELENGKVTAPPTFNISCEGTSPSGVSQEEILEEEETESNQGAAQLSDINFKNER